MPMKTRNRSMDLMHKINVYGFAMFEAVLYLDTHPDDCEARAYFSRMRDAWMEAKSEYVACVGPLSLADVNAENYWQWIENPWPWEGGDC